MIIWELSILELGYSSYYFPEKEDEVYFIELMNNVNDEAKPIENWKPMVLLKEEQRVDPDYFDVCDTGALITNQKGAMIFKAFCDEGSYQLLPFLSEEDELYLFHLVKPTAGLNKKKCIFEVLDNGKIVDFDRLSFNYGQIKDQPIFKVQELPYTLFINSDFKHFYEELELKGVNFENENIVFID